MTIVQISSYIVISGKYYQAVSNTEQLPLGQLQFNGQTIMFRSQISQNHGYMGMKIWILWGIDYVSTPQIGIVAAIYGIFHIVMAIECSNLGQIGWKYMHSVQLIEYFPGVSSDCLWGKYWDGNIPILLQICVQNIIHPHTAPMYILISVDCTVVRVFIAIWIIEIESWEA